VLVAMLRLSGNFHTEGFKGTVMDLVFDVLAAVVMTLTETPQSRSPKFPR